MKVNEEKNDLSESAEEAHRRAQRNLRDLVLEESRKGNVVCMGLEGLEVVPLDEFIKQPADGILYDLNRLPEVVTLFLDDPKWVNDFAVSLVIKRLREQLPDTQEAK